MAATVITALFSAVTGMGGGIALLAVMTLFLPGQAVVPIHGLTQLGANFSRIAVFWSDIRWKIVALFGPPTAVGAWIAAMVHGGKDYDWVKGWIGIFILAFLLWKRLRIKSFNPPLFIYIPLGFLTGLLGIFVGATGPFIAPFFLRSDMENEDIVATKAACQTVVHLVKLPVFLSIGFSYEPYFELLLLLLPCAFIGTYFGRRLISHVSPRLFKAVFEWLLFIIAWYLIFKFGLLIH